ncbi:MAG: isoprenoid biosynthesis glyoxalase ElbB [Desulfosarcinaceae bacterium]|nr:isoprenoid biosynthesis glyoxalase ElbB [Desulfosarcinaceae bacterium]
MAKNIGVLLSGCGVYDGSEIHEAVLTLLFLANHGAEVVCLAPDMEQVHAINHVSQVAETATRNVMVEAARIARGEIQSLDGLAAEKLDALILPGGFGAAKNLCDFALVGPDARVHPQVNSLLTAIHAAGKPIGAMCIAPAVVVRTLGAASPRVTIGNDVGTAAGIAAMGGEHVNCTVEEICVDEANKIVSTPAYMLGPGISDIAQGIEKLVVQVLAWC